MGVVFVASALLAGLLLAVVPPLIHLISKRRARRVRFAAMEFVLRSQRRTTRSLRMRQWLLLLVRTLLVTALVLALARPVWRAEAEPQGGAVPASVVLAVDVSASMHATLDGKSAFQRARAAAAEALLALPADVRVALIACDESPRDVVPEATFERAQVLRALEVLTPAFGAADLSACVERAAAVSAQVASPGEKRVLVFSDLAAHAFRTSSSAGAPPGLLVEWVGVWGEEFPPNRGLSAPGLERVNALGQDAVEMSFSVSQYGGVAGETPIDLRADGILLARTALPLEPGSTLSRSFTHDFAASRSTASALPTVTLQLEDDALALDNEVSLPVELPAPTRVLLVDGAPQPVPFRDEVFYLESALRQTQKPGARLDVQVIATENLTPASLADAQVVVLANVRAVPEEMARALVAFVRGGGGLLVTAGDQVDVDAFNAGLGEILPGRLRGAKGQALLDDASLTETLGLTRFVPGHPIFRGLLGADATGLPGLRRVATHTYLLIEPDSDAPRDILMRFSNEAPALLERRADAGRVMLLATSVDRDWSDLAIRPGYLPLMQQTVLYLAGALDTPGPRFLQVGEAREWLLPRGAERLEVRAPDGRVHELAPDQGAPAGEPPRVRFEGARMPGLYRVSVRYPGGDARELPTERFTVLVHPAESDLRPADAAQRVAAAPAGARVRGGDAAGGDAPLWPGLFWLVALLFALEAWWLRRA